MKTIVLGVGNPILKDDGVGIHVAEKLKQHIHDGGITIGEAFTGGMPLLEMMVGYDKAIIIDAVKIESKAGKVIRLSIEDFATVHSCNPHDIGLFEALKIADEMGINVPKETVVIGIVIDKALSFGENLSAEVEKAVPKAVKMVLQEIQARGENK